MHDIYALIKSDLQKSGLPVHDAKTHHGLLRHLMLREGVHTDHILVNLSIASKHFSDHPKDQTIWRNLLKKRKQDTQMQERITTFILSENNGLADIMRDAQTTHEIIWGEGKIYEELHYPDANSDEAEPTIVRFGISPASFFQTNTT
jgi:tRNA/tmRNA/rRNA uracil-C5-methylase (TrmA/RlmC/RlmD family)